MLIPVGLMIMVRKRKKLKRVELAKEETEVEGEIRGTMLETKLTKKAVRDLREAIGALVAETIIFPILGVISERSVTIIKTTKTIHNIEAKVATAAEEQVIVVAVAATTTGTIVT